MLVLSRRVGEAIQIGDNVEVTVVRIGPGVVRIGVSAPPEMTIVREEIAQRTDLANLARLAMHDASDHDGGSDFLKSR